MSVNQSNLPTIQRLKYEDYASAANWQAAFQSLVNSLNLFITPTYNILNGGVNYMNLTVPQTHTQTITAGGNGITTFSFANPLAIAPSAVLLGNVWTGITSTHPYGGVSAVQPFWHFSGGNVVIDNITGLAPGVQYTVTLVIL